VEAIYISFNNEIYLGLLKQGFFMIYFNLKKENSKDVPEVEFPKSKLH
jgi:hypothetical protein